MTYNPNATVAANAQDWSNTLDGVEDGQAIADAELASLQIRVENLESGVTPTPSPAPSFSQQPSLSPTSGTAGETEFTITPGVTINTTATTRVALLNGTARPIVANKVTANAAGTLTYQEFLEGPGGSAQSLLRSAMVAAAPAPTPTPTPTPGLAKVGQIGFNTIVDQGQGFPSFLYLNRMKTCGYNAVWNNESTLSQYGYPQTAGTQGRDTATFVSLRRPATGVIRYVLRHNGTGLNWHWQAQGISNVDKSDPNRATFDVAAAADEAAVLVIDSAATFPDYRPDNPRATRDGIVIVELEHEAAFLANEDFYPIAVGAQSQYWAERFMEVCRTNNSQVRTIADKTPVGYCSYADFVGSWGPPLDVLIDLMNQAKPSVFWVNIPHAANVEYQAWFLQKLHDRLDPSIKINVERSNEPWNFGLGFDQGFAHWEAIGRALNPPKGNPQGYGYEAAQTMKLARAIFADQPDRLYCTANLQGDAPANYEGVAEGVALAGEQIGKLFDSVCIAAYTSGGAQDLAGFDQDPAKIQMLMAEVERFEATNADPELRVVSQDFIDQMRHGVSALGWPNTITLDSLQRVGAELAAFCRKYGIRHATIYEMQDLHTSMYLIGAENGRRFNAMVRSFQSDVRVSGTQAGSYERDRFAFLRANGISGTLVLTDLGPNNEYGAWSTKSNFYSPDSPLWAFYKWYNDNAPDAVLFEVNTTGNPVTNVGRAFSLRVSSYGGLFPTMTRYPVLKSGTLPAGLTYANGDITGTPEQVGNATLVFEATDAGGNKALRSITIAVAARVEGKRYLHWRIFGASRDDRLLAANPNDTSITSELRVKGQDGAYLDMSVVTATGRFRTDQYGSAYPPSRILDGSMTTTGQTPDGEEGEWTFDFGASNPIKPSLFEILDAAGQEGQAPGDFEFLLSDDKVNKTSVYRTIRRGDTIPGNAVYNRSTFSGAYENHVFQAVPTYQP